MASTPPRSALPALCARLADAPWFQMAIVAVIVGNAVVLGLETYDTIVDEAGGLLHWLDRVFLAIFVFELGVRIAAYGRTPWHFFRNGWNIFDFVIVAVAFVPGLAGSTTILRLARLLRVARLIRFVPEVQILLRGVARSLQPIGGLLVLTLLLLFLYGMVGWALFGDELAGAVGQHRQGDADALRRADAGGLEQRLRSDPGARRRGPCRTCSASS